MTEDRYEFWLRRALVLEAAINHHRQIKQAIPGPRGGMPDISDDYDLSLWRTLADLEDPFPPLTESH